MTRAAKEARLRHVLEQRNKIGADIKKNGEDTAGALISQPIDVERVRSLIATAEGLAQELLVWIERVEKLADELDEPD